MSDINYKCSIVRLTNVVPHPNADRLSLTTIFGNTVIVGRDTKVGELGIFFPLESQLGLEFSEANDLIRRKDAEGNVAGGMFDVKRRVRAIKLRDVPSMGFWCPITFLEKLGDITTLSEGDSFNEWEGLTISSKYIPKTNKARNDNPGGTGPVRAPSRYIREQFPEHFDTEHLFRNLHKISADSRLIITIKLHGTSFRCGNVLVKRNLSLLERVSKFFGANVQETEYDFIVGSRTVIKDTKAGTGYYKKDLWTEVSNSFFKDKLHKGEVIYGEIVGYVPGTSSLIQSHYTYGCPEGTCDVYVYRITSINADGNTLELSWDQIKTRCKELGVKHVPELTSSHKKGIMSEESFIERFTEQFMNTMCTLQPEVPEEGVCVRVEDNNVKIFKAKNFDFLQYETKQLDTGVIDMETQEQDGIKEEVNSSIS